jgi:hypothetical protein
MVKKLAVTALLAVSTLFGASHLVGVGVFKVCPTGEGNIEFFKKCKYSKRILPIKFLKKNLPNVNAISMWITRDWANDWYPAKEVNKLIKAGYTPIYIFYYFGDDISPKFVKRNWKAYFRKLYLFINYLKKVHGPKYVIINPEYNENGMEKSRMFDLLQAETILKLKASVPNVKVGVCPGDFGDYSKIWDPENWETFASSLQLSSKLADFIAFQEMRALTLNKPEEILNTPYRAWAFALYLHQKYKKPTMLAYLAISSYGPNGKELQKEVMERFAQVLPAMEGSADLIGINLMNFIDNPNHTGYFNQAEKEWGILTAEGAKKPAFAPFKLFK